MQKPTAASKSFNVVIAPLEGADCDRPQDRLRFDPLTILQAVLFGILGSLAADVGVAAAGGEPLTERDVWADIIAGSAGGATGGIAEVFGAHATVVAVVGAFVAGFVAQALFPPSPIPPHSA